MAAAGAAIGGVPAWAERPATLRAGPNNGPLLPQLAAAPSVTSKAPPVARANFLCLNRAECFTLVAVRGARGTLQQGTHIVTGAPGGPPFEGPATRCHHGDYDCREVLSHG